MNDLTRFDGESPFDRIKHVRTDGSEYWSARELQPLMGYKSWRNFRTPLDRAMKSAQVQGVDLESNFAGSRKITSTKPQEDYELSRFACYLVAMNGDPNMREVAAAQAYFAVKTREAETAPKMLTGTELVARALIEAQSMIEAKDREIAVLAPRAEYVDTYVTDGDLRVLRNVSKSLKIGEQELRQALLDHRWIYEERASRWSHKLQEKVVQRRYSAYADKARYFTPVPCHDAPRFRGEVDHTLKVTPAGAVAIAKAAKRWRIATRQELELGQGSES